MLKVCLQIFPFDLCIHQYIFCSDTATKVCVCVRFFCFISTCYHSFRGLTFRKGVGISSPCQHGELYCDVITLASAPRLFRSECVSFILLNLCGRTVRGCKKRTLFVIVSLPSPASFSFYFTQRSVHYTLFPLFLCLHVSFVSSHQNPSLLHACKQRTWPF
jgi:hypothetical protein